jgi:hypothetical protein
MNTISNRTYRDKYRLSQLDVLLRQALISEKVMNVDKSNNRRIQSPFGSTPSGVVQALAGTYTPATFTTTDDTLSVDNEFVVAEHIADFQDVLTNFDMFASRTEQMSFEVARRIDGFALNTICQQATTTYTTPTGGFTNAANVITIFSNIVSRLAGYSELYNGQFIVLENTDLVGLYGMGATNGFNFSDAVLRNGNIGSLMGVDIYVTRTGTFINGTVGTKTFANLNHRVAGVKNMATLAMPGGIKIEEKQVSGKTGMEVAVYGYADAKVWETKRPLIIDITLA